MAKYEEQYRPRRRGHVVFYVLTTHRWRGALLGALLAVFAGLVLWPHGVDDDSGRDPQLVLDGDVEAVPVLGGAVITSGVDVLGAAAGVPDNRDGSSTPDTWTPEVASTRAGIDPVRSVAGASTPAPRFHPFDEVRLERERTRSRQTEALQQAAADTSALTAEREQARARLQQLWEDSLRETEIEHLLEAQGYVVVAFLSDDRARIVVDALLDAQAATRIGELVARVADVRREAIAIVDSLSSGG